MEYKRKIYGYQCDIYGHLNNANYLMIYEEARSELLMKLGYSLEKLKQMGLHIYLTRVELKFKNAVLMEDNIIVKTTIAKINRLHSTWQQQIYNSVGELCNQATIEGVFVKNGKPQRISKEILAKFTSFIEE
ncbi:MAG TPA: hypothetical protein DHM37_03650 [Candidatus Cloacimonas sp.]|jgi:YbgC/YbaW family acyl-CoA thioester hydrolase|nr:acyl-CoA thioester hydrolase [Candidatus Cloacimonadota bacterium]HCX72791.1 hypothetical protein [Candidatus Cloacimonas sp.]